VKKAAGQTGESGGSKKGNIIFWVERGKCPDLKFLDSIRSSFW
jgi:hypothetical protein